MRTKTDIYNDMAAAIMTAYSTDHSRALSGAEWLQQLASELVDAIKADQPEPLADAFDEQESPGDGWHILKAGEILKDGDEFFMGDHSSPVYPSVFGSALLKCNEGMFRRRI